MIAGWAIVAAYDISPSGLGVKIEYSDAFNLG